MAWGSGSRKLFSEVVREESWYVAESDSEDVAEEIREADCDEELSDVEDPLCPTIPFSTAEMRGYRREWRSALIVKVMGRTFQYPIMAKRLNMLWARNVPIQITNKSNGYYFVRLTRKEDYERALTGGPWMIGDHYLTMQKGFKSQACRIDSTLVWIRLPDLPIELFNLEAVLCIASRAGTPLRVDRATEMGSRGMFARACIEVDLTKTLLARYKVEGVEYEIKYEGLDNVCFECGMYGHSKSRCPSLHVEGKIPQREHENDGSQGKKHVEPYGSG
ncbi:unnamed protein product [Linum trigynum]|uniref:CCHC-type domain-containing protein n=1 Tax=Linum trigynum TaxID=586398 RepID=A0AAV2F4Z1_9ROSI